MSRSRCLLYLFGATIATQLLFMAAGLVGAAGFLINLLIPLPIALAVIVCGTTTGLGAALLVGVGLWAVGTPAGLLSYLLQFALGSVLLPSLLRRGWLWDRALAVTVVLVVALAAGTALGYTAWRGASLQKLVDGYVQSEVQHAIELYQGADLDQATLKEFRTMAEQTGRFLRQAYPGLAVVAAGLIEGVTLLLLALLARGRQWLAGPPFRRWRTPEWLIWPLIVAGFTLAFANGAPQQVALNLVVVLLPLYFLQGLAVVSHFFARRAVSPAIRAIGYLLIAILNPLPLIVTGIGVFDLWVDFRKPRIKKT